MKNKILIGVILISIVVLIVMVSKGSLSKPLKETEAACFEFDKEKGQITGYLDICSREVSIPEKLDGVEVVSIKNYAFRGKGLTRVVIPKTIKEIGIGAFTDNEIQELKLNEGVEEIKPLAFFKNKIEKLDIPSSVKNIGMQAFNNNELKAKYAFIYQRDNEGKENKAILIGYGGKNKEVEIPEGVETIYLNALSENNIKSIKLSKTVTRLEYDSLSDNEIEEIIIPENIMYLGGEILSGNPITKIVIEGKKSIEEFNYVGENWNSGCENIEYK